MSKNPRISISLDTQEKIKKLADEKNLTLRETVELLVNSYLQFDSSSLHKPLPDLNNNPDKSLPELNNNPENITYTESEKLEINKAINNSNLPYSTIVKDGTLQRVRYLNSIAKQQAELESLSDEELKDKTFKGVALHRINNMVEHIKNHNDMQGEKPNKVCLTRGIIAKLTGSNRQTINNFFDDYHIMIDDHNQKHQLTDTDNRKGKGFSFEELLGL